MIRKLLFIILASILLAACASKDNVEPPAELMAFVPRASMQQLWSANLGKGSKQMFYALTPASDGRLVFAATVDGHVTARDLLSGRVEWHYSARRDKSLRQQLSAKSFVFTAGPEYGEGIVVVGTAEGFLIALDARNGDRLWIAELSGQVLSKPAIGSGYVVARTLDGRMTAVSALDGSEAWTVEQELPSLTLRGLSNPVIDSGLVMAGFDNGRFLGVELATGGIVWEAPIAIPSGRTELESLVDIDGVFHVSRGLIFVAAYQGKLAAVAMENGQPVWVRDFSSVSGVDADRQYVYATDADSQLWAIDRNTGGPLWTQSDMRARSLTAPAALGSNVIVGDFDGYIHVIEKDTGALAARVRLGKGAITAQPLVINDVLVVQNEKAKLAAYRINPIGG